jgi:hypothetical protein
MTEVAIARVKDKHQFAVEFTSGNGIYADHMFLVKLGENWVDAASRLGQSLDSGATVNAAKAVVLPQRVNDLPPTHWTEKDGWKRHPQTAEEWNWRNDAYPDAGTRSELRLNFACDRADPHAPDQMALVLRIDLSRIMGRMQHAEAFKNFHLERRALLERQGKSVAPEVDPAVKLLADVMHLWVDGYISKAPNSMADDSVSRNTFNEIERFLATKGISVDYCGWEIRHDWLPIDEEVVSKEEETKA